MSNNFNDMQSLFSAPFANPFEAFSRNQQEKQLQNLGPSVSKRRIMPRSHSKKAAIISQSWPA